MGIQGLLPLLKSIMIPTHIKDFNGLTVAVDTYSWLHKGAFFCSKELCKGEPTSRHIDYCMHRVNLLRHYGVRPILVFDGGFLPMKSEQENKRARARKENLERAIEHEASGNSAAAYECYQKSVDISPSVAYELIQVLKKEKIDYVVAPYEADAQMTFLALSKLVDAVITEDSDLIPFGCPRIFFKMDKFGQGVEFQYSMIEHNKEMSFTGFTKQMVLEMCILSGCDYLQSLPGMGLKKAHALIRKFKSYQRVIKHLQYSTVSVPPLYEELFKKAIWTFQHQRVYDPRVENIVHLTGISDNLGDDLDFLGPLIPQNLAKGIAVGDLDPFTKMPFQGVAVCAELVVDRSYPLKEFKPESERKKLDLPAQKNVLTNYFCFASLEAKRKFKAPRVTPKHLDSIEENSPSSGEQASQKPASCTISCSKVSALHSGNTINALLSKDPLENGFALNGHQLLEFPTDVVGNLRNSDHSVSLHQSRQSVHKPCLLSHKEGGNESMLNTVDGHAGLVSRKAIVRSSYFKNKLKNEDDLDNKNKKLLVENDSPAGVNCDNTVPVPENSASWCNDLKSGAAKRKFIPIESTTETAKVKYARSNAILPSKRILKKENLDATFPI
ncbi:PREDICTED: exonuclease 1 isoform X2 [Nelumbo nucifera]|uniref:Exonuclease 1 n=1 Tax=Nelumbo nucifera TaxID=4432 RepID=A0A1U8QAY4_NELNU|nr:PREDICTED: exonuclease 1 isoform X2 [Nelumbo nucifera]